jgi:hypothetical protein
MQPIALSLRGMLAMTAFVPAVVTVNPGGFYPLIAVFLGVLSLPALIGFNLFVTRRPADLVVYQRRAYWLGVTFFVIQAIALIRGNRFSGSVDVRGACFNLLVYMAMALSAIFLARVISARSNNKIEPFSLVVGLFGAYCATNLMAWMFGVSSTNYVGATQDQAQILSYFGISMARVLFPMSWGVNNFAVVAGVTMTMGLVKLAKDGRWRSAPFLIGIPLVCLLLTDSRAALACSVIASFAAVKAPRLSRMGLVLFWVAGALIVSSDVLPSVAFGSRQDGLGTLTGRDLIWAAGLLELGKFEPQHILGFGHYGQFESGLSSVYGALFGGYSDHPELISLHNTYLQAVMDIGYVGLVIMFMFMFSAIKALGRLQYLHWTYSAALAALMFLAMNGLTEVTMSFYQPWIILLLASIVGMFRSR